MDLRETIDHLTNNAVAKLAEVGPATMDELEALGWPRRASLQLLATAQATGLVTRSSEGVYSVVARG